MTPSAAALLRGSRAAGIWTRSFVINVLALIFAQLLLHSFEIHGASAYAVAAVGIELPTVVWWLTVRFWKATAFHNNALFDFRAGRWAWVSALFAVTIVAPLLLATSLPGILVAEWISPLRVTGFWTYVAASAITAALTIGLRQSRPLRFLRGFLAEAGADDAPPPTGTDRAISSGSSDSRYRADSS